MFLRARPNFRLLLHKISRFYCSNQIKDGYKIELPPEPTNCCMSGCANCVWIEYAQTLSKLLQDGGEKARKLILDKITDPNMRAYLATELRALERLKQSQNEKQDTNK